MQNSVFAVTADLLPNVLPFLQLALAPLFSIHRSIVAAWPSFADRPNDICVIISDWLHNFVSTLAGAFQFSLYDDSIKIDSFIEFCGKVIDSNGGKKVFLIVDNLRVHHAKPVKAWEEEHKDKIKLFYLPAYSPDYNLDEYLNQDLKQSSNRNDLPTNKEHLRKNTEKYMLSLQNNTQKVANFFKHPKVQYAS